MSAEVLIASYLRIAKEDLAGARQLSVTHNRNAMYLCSQAAEKIIRDADAVQAALTAAARRFGVDLDKPDAPATNAGPVR